MKNEYEKLFDSFLEITEFTLVKYFDGWGVIDLQEGNLGNIEHDRFENAAQLIERMDAYIEDYYVRSVVECLDIEKYDKMTWGEIAEKYKDNAGDSTSDVLVLDALCNHPEEIDLENCDHEVYSEKIYTVIFRCYSDGTTAMSFKERKDAVDFVKLESEGTCKDLIKQGYKPTSLKSSEEDIELYVPDTDIYYEWHIEESMLF